MRKKLSFRNDMRHHLFFHEVENAAKLDKAKLKELWAYTKAPVHAQFKGWCHRYTMRIALYEQLLEAYYFESSLCFKYNQQFGDVEAQLQRVIENAQTQEIKSYLFPKVLLPYRYKREMAYVLELFQQLFEQAEISELEMIHETNRYQLLEVHAHLLIFEAQEDGVVLYATYKNFQEDLRKLKNEVSK